MREFLRGLELNEETVDKIMTEVGKSFTKIREQNSKLLNACKSYENKVNELVAKNEEITKNAENFKNIEDENRNLKAQIELNGANVKKEFSKFVTSEVMGNVNEEVDFATALENYKKDNPQYFGDTVVKRVQSSPNLNAGGSPAKTTNDIMNDILRNSSSIE